MNPLATRSLSSPQFKDLPFYLPSAHRPRNMSKMLSHITAFLALGAIAQAAPTPAPAAASSGSAFHSVTAIRNPNYVRNGTASLLKAYAKYHIQPTQPMSDAFMSALQKRQDSSAPALPVDRVEYLVPTTIGGQTLNLDLDTGSADL